MKDFIKKNKFNICVMFIYSTITLITILFHENWRDEAQSWLIARDLNFVDIFKQMRYEGHPCLWHLIIAPFAKLGFPYITQNIISWIIMCITAILILWKSPFDKFIKILILFSAPFIYFYSAISRSYCLIPLALVLIAITYKNRKEKPINYVLSITLLAHTHILMLGLVGMLYLFFFFEEIIIKFNKKTKQEKKIILFSLLIAILGLVLLFIQLFSSLQTNTYVEEDLEINESKMAFTFNVLLTMSSRILGNSNLILLSLLLVGTAIICIYELVKCRNTTLIMLGSLGFQLFIYVFIYSDLSYQKTLTSLLILIFWGWIQKYEVHANSNKKQFIVFDIYLSFILMFNCILGMNSLIKEIKYDYSYAKQTAKFINTNISKDSVVIASSIPHASALIPYTNGNMFWSPQTNSYFTFSVWDEKTKSLYTINEFQKTINERFEDKDNIYLIYCYNWTEEGLEYFIDIMNAKQIFRSKTNSIQKDEKYIVYKLYNN